MGNYAEFINSDKGVTVLKQRVSFRELILFVICMVLTITALGICVALIIHHTTYTEVIDHTNVTDYKNETCMSASCLSLSAILAAWSDHDTDPCYDFHKYACGNWDRYETKAAIKPDEQERTIFHVMFEENEKRIKRVLESEVKSTSPTFEKKMKEFYTSCTDEYTITNKGAKPFKTQILDQAGGWNVITNNWNEENYDLTAAMKRVHSDFWTDALMQVFVSMDWLDTTKNSLQLGLGGLTLYWWEYTNTDDRSLRLQNATRTFMTTVADLVMRDAGKYTNDSTLRMNKAREFAQDVFEFERTVGNLTWYTLPADDPHANENRVSVSELNSMSPTFDWVEILTTMFREAGLTRNSKVVLLEPNFLREIDALIQNLPNQKRTLNNYFTWKLMQGYVSDLGWEYVHANRDFYVARTGLTQFLGIPKACFNYVERHFGDALGALFIRDHLLTDDKAKVDEMVHYLKQGLADSLNGAKWMDNKTRAIAIEKEMDMKEKLGYPTWMVNNDHLDSQYAQLTINPDDYLGNLISIANYDRVLWNNRLKNGENRDDWRWKVYDTAGTYDSWWNELLIPAGLIQFPLWGKNLPRYYNFGSLGANLAHEMTHAVDEIGGYYLKNGTYFDWWSPDTTKNYNTQRKCLEDLDVQAGPYRETPTSKPRKIKIDGTYVARELIAETGGVRIGYNAYKDWVAKNQVEKPPPGLNITIDQTYFLAFAQTQCFVRRDPFSIFLAERHIIPENVRVNLALAHTPEFVKAFNCPVESVMHAEKMCEVF